jgi:hypothetical protein
MRNQRAVVLLQLVIVPLLLPDHTIHKELHTEHPDNGHGRSNEDFRRGYRSFKLREHHRLSAFVDPESCYPSDSAKTSKPHTCS